MPPEVLSASPAPALPSPAHPGRKGRVCGSATPPAHGDSPHGTGLPRTLTHPGASSRGSPTTHMGRTLLSPPLPAPVRPSPARPSRKGRFCGCATPPSRGDSFHSTGLPRTPHAPGASSRGSPTAQTEDYPLTPRPGPTRPAPTRSAWSCRRGCATPPLRGVNPDAHGPASVLRGAHVGHMRATPRST